MTNPNQPANSTGHGRFEPTDIGVSGVLYFLAGLAVFVLVCYLIVDGLYYALDKQAEKQQAPISPLVANAPKDTRHLGVDYRDYLKQNFPSPQLEIDERGQLDDIRIKEEQTLASYDYVDQNAGTVRIPIDRAMDLIAQRGLPVRAQGASEPAKDNNKNAKGAGQ